MKTIFGIFEKWKVDAYFRIKLLLFCSVVFNLLYAIFLLVVCQIYFSKWFFVMSVYYGLLSIMRIFIFVKINAKTSRHNEVSIMRTCGCFLFLLNATVSAMMFLLIYTAGGVKHHEITVITLATYTFGSLSFAIFGIVKYWKKNAYVYFSIKMISLISASVSLVTLTNTMLSTFGDDIQMLRSILLRILSVVVSVFILYCAIYMVRKANLVVRNLSYEEE